MISYLNKYIKYKYKYLNLKKHIYQLGGSRFIDIKPTDIIQIYICFTWNTYKYMGKVNHNSSEKHFFEKQDDGEGEGPYALYKDTLESLLYELDDIRKEDKSIFNEFLPDIKTITELGHFKYNTYKYPTTVLVPIDEIIPGRPEKDLDKKRRISIEKLEDDPNILLEPIKVNKDNIIEDGNHRYYVSKNFNFKFIPVLYI